MTIVRSRTLGVFVVVALVLVAALAVALLNSRSQARNELEQNFTARAGIAAAVIDSTLQAAAQSRARTMSPRCPAPGSRTLSSRESPASCPARRRRS